MRILVKKSVHNPSPSGIAVVHAVPVCLLSGEKDSYRLDFSQSAHNVPLVFSKAQNLDKVAAYMSKRLGPTEWLVGEQVYGLDVDKDLEEHALSIAAAAAEYSANETPKEAAE